MSEPLSLQSKIYAIGEDRQFCMQDLLDYFARHGSMRVSDLHLKVGLPPIYRVDGDLQKLKGAPVDAATMEKFARLLLSDLEWQTLQAKRSVDTSCKTAGAQYRVNVFHDNDGYAMAVRALESQPPPVEQIGFPNRVWEDILTRQQGLVLLTGVTGSGKSTTIASLIDRIAQTRPCRIITMEDPIEYRLKSKLAVISQREVGRDVPDFERGLRDALREDPDVIFVGEMRDRESASWTLTAAETGHLVFSTLHTRDVRGTITRLLDMFPPNRQDEVASQLSLGLSHIICQKLIPRADGNGRVVAMEILNNTWATANLIRLVKVEQIYSQLQTKVRDLPGERMLTLENCLVRLIRQGVITPAEGERWSNHPVELLTALRQGQGEPAEA